MKNYLNLAIQLLNVLLALVPNLIYPLIFGLQFHGEFLIVIALPTFAAFLAGLPYDNLLLKELAAQRELGLGVCLRKIMWQKLAVINVLFIALSFAFTSPDYWLQIAFINSVGISSFFLTSLYADNRKPRIAGFLVLFGVALLSIAVVVFLLKLSVQMLVAFSVAINLLGALVAASLLRERWRNRGNLVIEINMVIQYMGIASAIGTLSYGVVAMAGGFIAAERLSLLRIGISIAQAATSFFPVNQRTILENIVSSSSAGKPSQKAASYITSAIQLIAMMSLSITVCVIFAQIVSVSDILPTILSSIFKQYQLEIMIMMPAISLFLLGSVLEKVIIGLMADWRGLVFGIVSVVLIVTISLISMTTLPAGGFTAYALSSAIVVITALVVLKFSFSQIIKPISLVLALNIALTGLVFVASIGMNWSLFAMLITGVLLALFSWHLWKHCIDDLAKFIRL